MVLPVGAERHHVDENQTFLMAASITSPMPEFPSEAKGADGLHEVCVEFVVTEDGLVEQIGFPGDSAQWAPVDGDATSFREAVAEALSQWSFTGAAICTFPEGVAKDDECGSEGAEIRAVPIRLRYVFSFEQVDGKRSVVAK